MINTNKPQKNFKENLKNIKNTLLQEHDGSTAIETTILLPLMFGTFTLLLYLLFMMLAYVAYNNIASNIAHQMNMRQSGYTEAVNYYTTMPTVYSYGVKESVDSKYAYTVPGQNLTPSDVTITVNGSDASSNIYLRNGLYFALCASSMNPDASLDTVLPDGTRLRGTRIADQFIIPYVQVDHITVDSTKPLNFATETGTMAAANSIITVEIDFHPINPLSVFNQYKQSDPWWNDGSGNSTSGFNNLIRIKSKGYDVIS